MAVREKNLFLMKFTVILIVAFFCRKQSFHMCFFGEKSKTITHFHVTLKTPSSQPVILVQCNIYFSYKAPLVPPAYFGYLIAPACVSFVVHSIVCNLCYTRWGCWTLVLLVVTCIPICVAQLTHILANYPKF